MHWPKFTKALLFVFIIMKGVVPTVLFFKMFWGCLKKVTGCGEDDCRGKRGVWGFPCTPWLEVKAVARGGEAEDSLSPLLHDGSAQHLLQGFVFAACNHRPGGVSL